MANCINTNSVRLEMLSRDNYDTWKIQAEAILIKPDAWIYVSGDSEKPEITGEGAARAQSETRQKEWIKADQKAKADIILSISPSELKQIKGCITSKDVWTKLNVSHSTKCPRATI